MEALLSQFTLLSDQACQDKNFDPSSIDDLLKLFELEAYKSWTAMELEQEKEVKQAEVAMQQAEDYLDRVMEDAMDEFRRFEVEMELMARNEMESLEKTAESARNMGNLMEKAATIASTKYMEAALNSASASMKTAWKGLSTKKAYENDRKASNEVYGTSKSVSLQQQNRTEEQIFAALECYVMLLGCYKPLLCSKLLKGLWPCGISAIGKKWLDNGSEAFMWLKPQRIWPLAQIFQTSSCPKITSWEYKCKTGLEASDQSFRDQRGKFLRAWWQNLDSLCEVGTLQV
ncbi:hypothetical protein POTOM_024478 [Populus tomentosa]|uniref:Uncharacterized protein n=1 Tax=Populus tomentosa TaxID=118781 RepID=A0A8X7ZGU7_POPTO|nr:hypothetical protein POTOM_024478 [Populus tomentosa]